jgi:type I restriction enzyme M protein
MPSKRDVLAHLTRDELLAAADEFDLNVADRRVKEQLVGRSGVLKVDRTYR